MAISAFRKIPVSPGIYWLEIPAADLRILCGCPVDSVKHLLKLRLIVTTEINGRPCQTGPNSILLSDLSIQNGRACNRAEFPVLQMLYLQGQIIPGHPGNTGQRPRILGSENQVQAQMEYLYRGNYGLASREELIEAGVEPALADDMMRMKLAFAFGRILPMDELVQPIVIDKTTVAIGGGATVRRLRTNVFEFAYAGETIEVDLNLAPSDIYECPYSLDKHVPTRSYFAVIHTGDGDGWDMNRPTMGSIVLFQGHVYLVDAGPNIDHALTALGISVNEIDGIFHTHCHDDHQSGLTALIRGDKRLKYYAAPMVRASAFKKLAAVMRVPEEEFHELFDVHDLAVDTWNDIEGLEVRPLLSPHPVETTILQFRVLWEGGYRTYAHLADVAAQSVMRKMITADHTAPGISQEFFDRTVAAYAEPADIKKIDIGGGLIHGVAQDFQHDQSGKVMLAHIARRLTEAERAIGSGAPFGTMDVLIEGESDSLRRRAFHMVANYFPAAPLFRVRHLINSPIKVFNPEEFLYKEGHATDFVYLVVTGSVELLRQDGRGVSMLSTGSILGETAALSQSTAPETCRALCFVQAMCIPYDLYLDFVGRLLPAAEWLQARGEIDFLRTCWLFSEGISCVKLGSLVRASSTAQFAAGSVISVPKDEVLVIQSGAGVLQTPSGFSEPLRVGDHIGTAFLRAQAADGAQARFTEAATVRRVPVSSVADIPVVRWKLLETHLRRYIDH
jgi:hemerythrin